MPAPTSVFEQLDPINMRLYFIFLALVFSSCTTEEANDMAAHNMGSMVLEADAPLSTEYSVYQVESAWQNQAAEEMQLAALAGRVQVVALTYTSCEMSCPVIVAAMKSISEKVKGIGFALISIDPERDTPATLNTYATKMNLDPSMWNLLQGNPDDVREMAALLGVRYKKMEDGDFAHSNILTVLDENGIILHQQNGMAPDLTRATIAAVQTYLSQEEK